MGQRQQVEKLRELARPLTRTWYILRCGCSYPPITTSFSSFFPFSSPPFSNNKSFVSFSSCSWSSASPSSQLSHARALFINISRLYRIFIIRSLDHFFQWSARSFFRRVVFPHRYLCYSSHFSDFHQIQGKRCCAVLGIKGIDRNNARQTRNKSDPIKLMVHTTQCELRTQFRHSSFCIYFIFTQ